MKAFISLLMLSALVPFAFAQQAPPREEWHRGLRIENAVRTAELIVAVSVEEVTKIQLMRGGKGESSMLQFRFKPLRVVKGVFARPELILGSPDLGYQIGGQLKFMKPGQKRLLFLSRSDVGYRNCNEANSLDQTLLPLAGEDDPLIQSVMTLLALNGESDRFQRVKLLIAALEKSSGPAASPLLAAISARAFLAAQTPGAAPAIARHLADVSPSVRIAAANALEQVLDADYLAQPELREMASAALESAFAKEGVNIDVRNALIRACSGLGEVKSPALISSLDFTKPAHSITESVSQVRSVGKLRLAPYAGKLFEISRNLPLDAPYNAEVEVALARLDPVKGSAEIARHAEASLAAGLGCSAEIRAAAALGDEDATALLIRLWELPLNTRERSAFAIAAGDICNRRPDDRLVGPLAKLLDPDEPETRMSAVNALLRVGTLNAAQALQPHLGEEASVKRKLMIAERLGKHGLRDGYAYAIEHVSEPYLTEDAVAALAAMNDPRTADEAKKIFETSNDTRWNSAAIRILGAIGAREFIPKFLALAGDWKNPLATSALIALGDLGEAQALPRIRDALNARSRSVALAGVEAASRLLRNPEIKADDVRDQLAALLASEDAGQAVREEALDALLALKDPRLDKALISAVADATLEQPSSEFELLSGPSPLPRIEGALRDRKIRLR